MATGKLIGAADATAADNIGANYISIDRFQCSVSGLCSEIRIKVSTSLHAKVAIYADNSGAPGDRLAKQDTGQACTAGWNTISLESAVELASGTYYWLALILDTTSVTFYYTGSGTHKYKAQTYAGFTWPGTISGLSDYNVGYSLIAGWGVQVLSPSSISQSTGCGSPKLSLVLKPSSIAQAIAVGMPAVATAALIIYPPGIAQAADVGVPALRYPQIISPPGIAQPVAVGQPWLGIFGFVKPSGIAQQVVIGSPALYKFVWHVILDGQYSTDTPRINRTFIIGKDQYGNPVYGTAVDSGELALVGERLDFQQEIAVPTESLASSMASAILSKMRISKARGFIEVPPNCGQELFDVVQISDSGANQSAVSFRVVGIRFEYNPKRAKYEHRLILGAP